MKGNLKKTEQGWFVTTDDGIIPVHPQHSFWLTIFGEENMEMNFEFQNNFVILKANGPDTHEYVQD